LDGISDIATRAQSCKIGDIAWQTCMEELHAKCSPLQFIQVIHANDRDAVEQRRRSQRATKLLRKASIAAAQGNKNRCAQMKRLALDAVEGDSEEFDALIEMYRFSFTPAQVEYQQPQPRMRMGFC